jgi:coenzyme F420-reducing hydrogenase delta subunit
MFNISSAMAGQFAAAAKEMTEQITAVGPSPLRLPREEPAKSEMENVL